MCVVCVLCVCVLLIILIYNSYMQKTKENFAPVASFLKIVLNLMRSNLL